MGTDPLSDKIRALATVMDAASTAASLGNTRGAEIALVDVYNRVSLLLKELDEGERAEARRSNVGVERSLYGNDA